MRAPGWLDIKHEKSAPEGMRVTIRVRLWHPGFWLYAAREWWRQLRGLSDG